MSSNVSTPVLGPVAQAASKGGGSATTTTAKPAPNGGAVDLDDIPPLTLGVLSERTSKVDALKLVADSIAQQRQISSRSLVSHPLNLAGLIAAFGVAYRINPNLDLGMTLSLVSGIIMTYLMTIRYFSAQYIPMAEGLKWDWLLPNGGGEDADPEEEGDTVIGARFGEEMIGALVLRLVPASADQGSTATAAAAASPASAASRKKNNSRSSSNNLKGGHGVIRAWTTKLRYRRRGVGGDLLQEAVQVTRERCGKDATLRFAQDHANSNMVLPDMYNSPFRKIQQSAVKSLEKALNAPEPSKQKR